MTLRRILVTAGAIAMMLVVIAAALSGGAVRIEPRTLMALLSGAHDGNFGAIFWALRVPRVLIAILVGAALAVSGALLQGLLRNPLVDPYLTGASGGASLAIAVGELYRVPAPLLPIGAFLAALGVALLSLSLARTRFGISPERIILAGVALSALCSAVVTMIVLTLPGLGEGAAILAWLGGSIAGRGWAELHWIVWYATAGFVSALLAAPMVNMLRIGEDRAGALGLERRWSGAYLITVAALLTAVAVSLAGMIGFVGMIVPHVARRVVGGDARWVLPLAACIGATTLVGADYLARAVAAPLELPLGVLLAFIGVPAFLLLAFRSGARGFHEL